jgi:hypothetical protein
MAEQLFPYWSISIVQLNSVFGLAKVEQKPYNSSIKHIESRSHLIQFLDFSNNEKGAPREENSLFHYPPEACSKQSALHFWEVGRAL